MNFFSVYLCVLACAELKVLRDRQKRVTPTPKLIGVGAFNTLSRMACQILFGFVEVKINIDAASI